MNKTTAMNLIIINAHSDFNYNMIDNVGIHSELKKILSGMDYEQKPIPNTPSQFEIWSHKNEQGAYLIIIEISAMADMKKKIIEFTG